MAIITDASWAPVRARLSDAQLADLSASFDWLLWFYDAAGRKVGGGKTQCVHGWNDQRVVSFIERFPLRGKRILEPGCLEGVLTCALCHAGAEVTAFDARSTCVAKAHARTGAFGFFPKLMVYDARQIAALGEFDAVFHSGVLYHLPNPAEHLRTLRRVAPFIGLHTHTAEPADDEHEGYRGLWQGERGWGDEWSGVEERSFWPTRAELRRMIHDAGFDCEMVFERERQQYRAFIGWYLLRRRP